MGNKPLVSVIMNCYNSDTYLKEAIESVLLQTYENWEIIFWDNQSTDNSAKIVKSYDDNRIKYFYALEHTSLGEGRNQAVSKVNGELISFLDCDDLYTTERIEVCVNYLINNKSFGLVYSNGTVIDENGRFLKNFYSKKQAENNLFLEWIKRYNVMIPSVMFRKCLTEKNSIAFDSDFSLVEEYDFFLQISEVTNIGYVHKKLCSWRRHVSSLTHTSKYWLNERVSLRNKLIRKHPMLSESYAIRQMDMIIGYFAFVEKCFYLKVVDRSLIKPYISLSLGLKLLYFLSFLGSRFTAFFIKSYKKYIRKNL
ncbi:MAG: glycosyltransferase [Candidatus Endonucleobacter sp. (ex Gigantidas childressi)]|nr:glycosyltransferase [Candidatus Endonucleobacter sp. (ex Gigantidas childressi)]